MSGVFIGVFEELYLVLEVGRVFTLFHLVNTIAIAV